MKHCNPFKPILLNFVLLLFSISACAPRIGEKQEGTFTSEEGLRIHYQKMGSGGNAVVFIQPECIDFHIWDSTIAVLNEDYTILTFEVEQDSTMNEPKSRSLHKKYPIVEVMNAAGIRKAVFLTLASSLEDAYALLYSDPLRVRGIVAVNPPLANRKNNSLSDCLDKGLRDSVIRCLNVPKEAEKFIRSDCYLPEKYAFQLKEWDTVQIPLQIIQSGGNPPENICPKCPGNVTIYTIDCPSPLPMLKCPHTFQRELRIALASITD